MEECEEFDHIQEDFFKSWYDEHLESSNLKSFSSKFYMERDILGKPLCFFEVARDPHSYEMNYFLTNLPRSVSIKYPCYLVLYDDRRTSKMNSFRVKRIFPKDRPFESLTPKSFLGMISASKEIRARLYPEALS